MCYSLRYNAPSMLPAGGRPLHYTTSCKTRSSAPEDGQHNCPKHVELIGIINKPILLHLVGCLYYFFFLFHTLDVKCNLLYFRGKFKHEGFMMFIGTCRSDVFISRPK